MAKTPGNLKYVLVYCSATRDIMKMGWHLGLARSHAIAGGHLCPTTMTPKGPYSSPRDLNGVQAKDPVCGMMVDPATTAHHHEVGRTH